MSRYIDADEVLEQIRKKLGIKSLNYLLEAERQIVDAIQSAPSIDIEPKRGENLLKEYHSLFECSVCGASCDDTYPWDCDINFCPNCGTRMK